MVIKRFLRFIGIYLSPFLVIGTIIALIYCFSLTPYYRSVVSIDLKKVKNIKKLKSIFIEKNKYRNVLDNKVLNNFLEGLNNKKYNIKPKVIFVNVEIPFPYIDIGYTSSNNKTALDGANYVAEKFLEYLKFNVLSENDITKISNNQYPPTKPFTPNYNSIIFSYVIVTFIIGLYFALYIALYIDYKNGINNYFSYLSKTMLFCLNSLIIFLILFIIIYDIIALFFPARIMGLKIFFSESILLISIIIPSIIFIILSFSFWFYSDKINKNILNLHNSHN